MLVRPVVPRRLAFSTSLHVDELGTQQRYYVIQRVTGVCFIVTGTPGTLAAFRLVPVNTYMYVRRDLITPSRALVLVHVLFVSANSTGLSFSLPRDARFLP